MLRKRQIKNKLARQCNPTRQSWKKERYVGAPQIRAKLYSVRYTITNTKILLFGLVKTLKRAGGGRQVALYASAAARKLANIVELAIYIRLCWRENGGVQAYYVKLSRFSTPQPP